MEDRKFLHILHATLTEYQRQRGEPSHSIARLVLVVEQELQILPDHFPAQSEAERTVDLLIRLRHLLPWQRRWAEEYYKRDLEAFALYIRRNPKP